MSNLAFGTIFLVYCLICALGVLWYTIPTALIFLYVTRPYFVERFNEHV
jgi:hypothetical protein